VVPKDESQIPKIKTNIEWIDKLIGGWLPGELTIWTGKRGEGKSTFLGQMLLEAIHEGEPVVAYSGELTAQRFQNWIHLQATGERHIQYRVDEVTQKTYPYIDKAIHQKIRDWYRGKFFLFDNSINFEHSEENSIIKVFTYAVKRYDCKLFMVDNLMTARFDGLNDSDYYRRQSNFVGELVRFAKAYDVHVHLVAHPKKTNPQDDLDNDSISGTADITNRADNVIAIKRLKEPIMNTSGYRADATLTILKNRSDGVMNESLALAFDTASKRFYNPMDPKSKDKVYGWEKRKVVKEVEREIPPWEE
jgi:twinkle protein